MPPSYYFSTDYEVGDLVILLHSIDWITFFVPAGELAIIIEVYEYRADHGNIYDCRLRLTCGGELDVWFGEIKKVPEESK